MTTTYTDTFHRPDENPLSDHGQWGGDVLGRPDHPLAVSSNVCVAPNAGIGNSGSAYLLTPTSSADCSASVTIATQPSYFEIFTRLSAIGPSFNGYALVSFGGGNVWIYIATGGSSTPLLDCGVASAPGETWTLKSTGITQAVLRNGVQMNHFDDPTYGAAGYVGLLAGPDSGGTTFSQFSAGPFPDPIPNIQGPPLLIGRMGR